MLMKTMLRSLPKWPITPVIGQCCMRTKILVPVVNRARESAAVRLPWSLSVSTSP
jgi:hypothetical protein